MIEFFSNGIRIVLSITAAGAVVAHASTNSVCYGTVSNGRIDAAVQLPASGANFSSYSDAAVALGRTYVHARVANVVSASYKNLEASAPDVRFVYGETGFKSGGVFKPHRTHQNGLSVDFFVPVRDASGRSVPLPTDITNKFGYAIEFDKSGRYGKYTIDFEALAEHLYQLHFAAKRQQAPIKLVIFDPPYLPKLFATKRGAFLKKNLHFMKQHAWVRHDEHYHVDFSIPCKPLK
jgi:penicillin-insensitive murein DD-endopeptidase